MYEGEALRIAIIGEPPIIKEEQVEFNEISFEDLTNKDLMSYDAVLITKEHLNQASESQYADVYLNSTIPFFFISAKSRIPFTMNDEKYSDSWGWIRGNSYAVGVIKSEEGDKLNGWGYSLYNDEKKDEYIKEVYSRIFKTIEEQR
ncbi:hypothetical protein [Halobacillus seohaensis]|uniref:Uncharacterized protein n=1 Tax=Halobacillus seohaensis TaxID=447421 RepID=A0ABW2ETP2_9BACI